MHALPPAPAVTPRRQVFVGTAIACAAVTALMGGLFAVFIRHREDGVNASPRNWLPDGVSVPGVATNTMLIALLPICLFAQWAVYSAKRHDRPHAGLALGLTGLLGLAFINAQAYVWGQMGVPANQGVYSTLFYTVTGAGFVLAIIGVVFSGVTAFRFLGGRTTDREVVSAHAMYWYTFSAVFSVLWFVVYVTK
ncbi:MAG TPA: hypothetical protein DCR14_07000 [Acidimicrobiaceae bacterium]|nr:hypothetical protein [Acidimicrobiaceae bacterium]